ncbi:T9SS type A sorting domain-containing protein [candidate division WOR-3 bacterium]|nr:T9SS type A sorting domain-containing protein [candidate division WOR-3 bacterium]
MRKAILLLIPLLVFAQNFVLQKDVLSSGGRKMTSTDYILNGTISQTAIGSVADTDYQGVIGFWHPPEPFPPEAPYIYVTKSGNDAVLTWNKITTDTLGNPETMYYYVVYRSTDPAFIPGNSDSIGITLQPDTTYTDAGANSIVVPSYYYLVKAVDVAGNLSKKSNMGYKFNKVFNENAGATSDRNWVSLPWHSEYATASELTDDLSPAGEALLKITNLKDDQTFESLIYHPVLKWYGTDFTIDTGTAYEMIGAKDSTLVVAGSNNPDGLVVLNENTGSVGDRNWVAIPYNVAYSTIGDVTDEYSIDGQAIVKVTNLKDDQTFESWIYHPVLKWYGTDYSITVGRGYEFVAVLDTVWDPTEYTNRLTDSVLSGDKKINRDVVCFLGTLTNADRIPVWSVADTPPTSSVSNSSGIDYLDVTVYSPKKRASTSQAYREAGISHTVYTTLNLEGTLHISFTAYRIRYPEDVLTENTVGSIIAREGTFYVMTFDVGNFMTPWQDGEEVVVLIEVATTDEVFYDVKTVKLDQGMDIQPITGINLKPVPEIRTNKGVLTWNAETKEPVIGYSVYSGDQRLNDHILTGNEFTAKAENVIVRPVIKGGYETVLSPTGIQEKPQVFTPISYSFSVFPNPFAGQTGISYALPRKATVAITIYDVSGRQVKALVSGSIDPGCYTVEWNGNDDLGRVAAAGVYFITIRTDDYQSQKKVILVR